jgi:hypothetical protein
MRAHLVVALIFAAGCLGGPPPGAGNGSGNGNGNGAGNGSGNGNGAGGIPDPGCGKSTFPISLSKADPNVMLVVDDSGSMQDLVPGTTQSKWTTLKTAVKTLLTSYTGKVRWGVSIFPSPGGNSCSAGQVDIACGPGNESKITALLDPMTDNDIGGNTPTETTLRAVEASGALRDPMRNNYVLLMTDGLPTCNQDGRVTPAVQSMYRASPSIRTFVVGIGDGTQSDPGELNRWADAGGTARAAQGTKYYQANNITDLNQAFGEIIGAVASCTYQLADRPPEANLLVPYLDGQAVAPDPNHGFSYDAGSNSLVFHGSACDRIKAGGVTNVDVIYGCPSPPIL